MSNGLCDTLVGGYFALIWYVRLKGSNDWIVFQIFGAKLVGKPCNVDSDCVTPYSTNDTSYYCEVKGKFNAVVNPNYEFRYTKGKCIEPYDAVW